MLRCLPAAFHDIFPPRSAYRFWRISHMFARVNSNLSSEFRCFVMRLLALLKLYIADFRRRWRQWVADAVVSRSHPPPIRHVVGYLLTVGCWGRVGGVYEASCCGIIDLLAPNTVGVLTPLGAVDEFDWLVSSIRFSFSPIILAEFAWCCSFIKLYGPALWLVVWPRLLFGLVHVRSLFSLPCVNVSL